MRVFSLLLMLVFAPIVNNSHHWVDWNGSLPPNAIRAGTDSDGGAIYIARAFHKGDVIPGKMLKNSNCAYFGYDGKEHKKSEFEVLCKGPSEVVWASSSNGRLFPGAIKCGQTSSGEGLYIGRVFHERAVTVGKIHPSHNLCYIPYGGKEIAHSQYEVLVIPK